MGATPPLTPTQEPVAWDLTVVVPVRVCDVGGWTDTWFAERGRVCSLAVGPGISVQASTVAGSGRVTIDLADYDVVFPVGSGPSEHRLPSEAVHEAEPTGPYDVHLRVLSSVPPASSVGTSAAVCVGIIAALDAVHGRVRPPAELAAAAHRVEAHRMGRQSGVQDQQAAAHGGINVVEIDRYPHAAVRPVAVGDGVVAALDDRLVHVAYGAPHDSSAVHEEVIAALSAEGPAAPRLEQLRRLAVEAEHALTIGDLDDYGRVLTASTVAQFALHPELVSPEAHDLIELARSAGALGWKVNGAGGGGGSVSILCRDAGDRPNLVDAARRGGHRPLDLFVAQRGAHVVGP